jgi:hypothetical protein
MNTEPKSATGEHETLLQQLRTQQEMAQPKPASGEKAEKPDLKLPCPFCGLRLQLRIIRNTVPMIHCNGCGCEVIEPRWDERTTEPKPATGELWQHKLADFVNLILHGDDEHKAWLREAGEAFILGNPIPPARHRQFGCAYCHRGVEAGIILLRVNKLGETPAIWICNEHFNYDDWKQAR